MIFSNSRTIPARWGIVIFLVMFIIGLISYYVRCVLGRGEIGQAEQRRGLQAIEHEYREGGLPPEPLFAPNAAGSEYSALGLPTGDKARPFTWILLNVDKIDDYGPIKILPKDKPFNISCAYVHDLSNKLTIHSEVLAYLKLNCRK